MVLVVLLDLGGKGVFGPTIMLVKRENNRKPEAPLSTQFGRDIRLCWL